MVYKNEKGQTRLQTARYPIMFRKRMKTVNNTCVINAKMVKYFKHHCNVYMYFTCSCSLIPLLEMMHVDTESIAKLDVQWYNIVIWYEVSSYKDSSDINPFFELSEFALKFLVFSWSNAEVERFFSQMNITKTKVRNKMSWKLLDSILIIKSGLKRKNTCCLKYQFPLDVLTKIEPYRPTIQFPNSKSN